MAQNNKSSVKGLPGWLIVFFWSVIGVATALLTIFVLTASLLWLLRWAGPQGLPGNPAPDAATGEVASAEADNWASSQTLSLEQAATATAAQLNATPAPRLTSPASSQPSDRASSASASTPAAEATPGAGATEPGDVESAGAPGTKAGGQSPPTSSLAQAETQATEQSESVSSPTGPGDLPDEQTAGTGSGSTGSAVDEATATPSLSPTSTPSPTSTNTPTPTPEPEPQEYIVQRDDWLSRLSDKFYGDILAYPAIVEATNAKAAEDDSYTFISDPDVIEVGQKLWIPTPEEAAVLLAEEEE